MSFTDDSSLENRLVIAQESIRDRRAVADEKEIADLFDFLAALQPNGQYGQVADELQRCTTWQVSADLKENTKLCLQWLLIYAMQRFSATYANLTIKLPDYAAKLYVKEFKRILDTIAHDRPYQFAIDDDIFRKDLAICFGHLVPAGCQTVGLSGVPRSILLRGGIGQFCRAGFYFFVTQRGFAPTMEIHMHPVNRDDFNRQGRDRCYKLVADIVALNPKLLGLQGSSWFYDPALKSISPHLAFVQDVPVSHGARLFFVSNESTKSGAFASSKRRREYFERGTYMPKTYLLSWSRKALMGYGSTLGAAIIDDYIST